jgi:hypothetical protein
LEGILLQDADPVSKNQNRPEFYYGMKGGIQASLREDLAEDADPASGDQNKPESYYGLPPKGVQASGKTARYRYGAEADLIDDALPPRAQALYTKLVTVGKLRSNLMRELKEAMLATAATLPIDQRRAALAVDEMLNPENYQ